MKTRVNKFKENSFYYLTGEASASSLFFEDAEDHQLFLGLLQRFLGEIIDLHFYSLDSTKWTLCFRTKDKKAICRAFYDLKKQSKKEFIPEREYDLGIMISEHFRFFLSAYVKQSNFRHKRHGVRVHSKMEKYIFERIADMEEEIEKMQLKKKSKRQIPKYRPNMRYYLVDKQLKRDSVWRQSLVGIGGEKLVKAVIPCFLEILSKVDLLRELITNTWNRHFGPTINPIPPPNLE